MIQTGSEGKDDSPPFTEDLPKFQKGRRDWEKNWAGIKRVGGGLDLHGEKKENPINFFEKKLVHRKKGTKELIFFTFGLHHICKRKGTVLMKMVQYQRQKLNF